MSFLRIPLTLALIITLAGAPALRAVAMTASFAPDAHAHHSMHSADSAAKQAAGGEMSSAPAPVALKSADQPLSSCAQHDFCNGQCCASCAQCFTAVSLRLPGGEAQHAVLTPVAPQLLFNNFVSQLKRPPRLLSV